MEIIHNTKSNEIDKLLPLKDYINSILEKPNNSDIYHYTTIEALYNGILRQNANPNEEICLRATSSIYLNDPQEIKIGLAFIENLLYGQNSGKKIFEKQSDIINVCSDYYITSFSKNGDSLPMWSMYAANATGISLRFEKEIMNDDCWVKCIYYNDKIQREVEEIIGNLGINYVIDVDFEKWGLLILILLLNVLATDKETRDSFVKYIEPILKFTLSLKNPAYSYEEEVRLFGTSLDKDKDKIKHRFKNNLIVPYIEQYVPKESLKEIIVGPNNDMERTIYSLEKYLKHIGFEHVKVTPSKVPYRS